MYKMIRTLGVFLSTCFLLISCGGNGDKGEAKSKIFRFNLHEGFSSMDPAFARNQSNIWGVTQVFNGLVELNSQMEVVPCLAESWEVSDSGRTYTFKIREQVKFHDSEIFPEGKGRELKAEDFVYSFNRIINPKTSSTGSWIFNDKVLRNEDGNISDTCFIAVDDYTLRIHLENPFPAFLQILTMPYAFVVPHEAIEKFGLDFRANPIGTGAFTFKLWEDRSTLIFLKNKNYWKKDSKDQQLPYLDAIQVSFIADKKVAFLSFMSGEFDFFSGLDENSKDIAFQKDGTIKDEILKKFNVEKVPYLNTEYLGFQLDKDLETSKNHPFQDRRVRQAMNYAIDRQEVINHVRNGVGHPADAGIIPKALPSYDPDKVVGYSYNPERAQELLVEAGYPNGKGMGEIKLYTQANSQYLEIAEVLTKQWEEIGIKVKVELNPFATHQELVDNSKVNFFRGSWLGDYPDGENYLTLFYSENFAPKGPNKTHFVNEQFDLLYEKAKGINDSKVRWEIYKQMDSIVVAEAPIIPLYYDEVIRFTSKRVKGIQADPMNTLKLEYVDVLNE